MAVDSYLGYNGKRIYFVLDDDDGDIDMIW